MAIRGGFAVLAMLLLAGCQAPFGLGTPTTHALEAGAAATLSGAPSFELAGTYLDAGASWTIDLQVIRPDSEHLMVSSGNQKLEMVLVNGTSYFRGQQFLADHVGDNPVAANLVAAAGNAWWKGPGANAPRLPDLTSGDALAAAFLGPAVTSRTDGASVDGIDAIELAGPRAEAFVASAPPYHLLRLRLARGASVDGLAAADLRYTNFGRDFAIRPPSDLIDFSNLSSLPPLYTVLSVDTSGCAGSPCAVSAVVKNLGGAQPARAPSTIEFTLTDNATRAVVGTCSAAVVPDVGYNGTTTVGCTIPGASSQRMAAGTVTATPRNPGRA